MTNLGLLHPLFWLWCIYASCFTRRPTGRFWIYSV